MKFADLFFIAAAVCASLFFLAKPAGDKPRKLILIHGEKQTVLPYSDGFLNLKKYTGADMELEIKDGRARMTSSDCPDKLCVKSGWADSCGHMIICMPNASAVMIDCSGDLREVK